MVTLDVSSLYTNIPHDEGIKACEEALDTRIDQSLPTEDLCHHIKLILTRNAFIFNEAFYLQQSGTAMGTRMAPSYANLFMGKFEREFLRTQTALPLVWWRFIDDVFTIWTHGEQQLQTFLGELNHHHTSIKFTANWSTEEVSFLCIIDRLWTDDVIRRKNRESRWIRTLGTLWPRGMNLRSDAF